MKELYNERMAFPNVCKLAASLASFEPGSVDGESGFSVILHVDKPTGKTQIFVP